MEGVVREIGKHKEGKQSGGFCIVDYNYFYSWKTVEGKYREEDEEEEGKKKEIHEIAIVILKHKMIKNVTCYVCVLLIGRRCDDDSCGR